MGTITGMTIANAAWRKVGEATGGSAARWITADALQAINNGMRECAELVRGAKTLTGVCQLSAGSRQNLGAMSLTRPMFPLDVLCNINAAGTVRGRSVSKIDTATLDVYNPSWRSTPGTVVHHWLYPGHDPLAFDVFPQPTATAYLEVIYAARPATMAALSEAIDVDDRCAQALEQYMLFDFLQRDASYSRSAELAAQAYALFKEFCGQLNGGASATASKA